MSIERQKL